MKRYFVPLLLLGTLAFGDNLPTGSKTDVLYDFSGGLNTNIPSHKLDNSFSPYLRNVFIDNNKIERVPGYVTLGSSGVLMNVTGIFPFRRETGQTTFLITDSSVTLETANFNMWTFVSSGSNTGTLLTWMQVRNKMWGFNGVDPVITWDGTTKVILDGSKGTPIVPKFRYGSYYQDRVFGFDISGAASDLQFTDVITTAAEILAPDDPRAWPGTNILHIGQGDGQVGTALWIDHGQLRAGKEFSIYTIYGDRPTNYNPRKEELQDGVVSNESVVSMDGMTNYAGRNGIYKNSQRITDLIQPDYESVNKDTSKIIQESWELQNDFQIKGSQFYGSTATTSGFLTLDTLNPNSSIGAGAGGESFIAPYGILGTASDDPPPLQPGTTFYGPFQLTFDNIGLPTVNTYSRLLVNKLAWVYSPVGGCTLNFASITIYNVRSNMSETGIGGLDGDSRLRVLFGTTSAISPLFDGTEILNSSITVKLEGCGFDLASLSNNGLTHLINSTTGQYISQITTLTSVTSWGNFDSIRQTNGGTVNYYIRAATSIVNITTQTWQPGSPGGVIPFPIANNFIQWATTMTSVSSITVPTIDNVTINYIQGSGSVSRPFGIQWKNRYWLSTSTNSNYASRTIFVKSISTNKNPDAWMPIEGIPVCSFAKDGAFFYGGSCNSGAVFRLDYGTNFNGSAIQSIYDTPDMIAGDPYFDKDFYKIIVEGTKSSGGTLTLGTSLNQGSFVNTSFSIDGVGRYQKIRNITGFHGKTLRIRLTNMELDKNFIINSLGVIDMKNNVLSEK